MTLLWTSAYSPFADRQLPEVADLAVLPQHRRQCIGKALLDRAESAASTRSTVVGTGVGLYVDYGGRPGHRNRPVEPGAVVRIDDDATLMLTRLAG